MAVPFIYLVFLLLFIHSSFSLPCSNPVGRCGNLDVAYPFFTNATPLECKGLYPMECDYSSPMIQFNGTDYKVINISYPDHVITVQDLALSTFFYETPCKFLYNFTLPIPAFKFYSLHPKLSDPFSCSSGGYKFFNDLLRTTYNFTPCKGYSLYYLNGSSPHFNQIFHENCEGSQPTLFEWVLSFSEANGSLSFSLLAAGFSHQSVLRKECFNCQRTGKNCSSSDESSYMCEPLFQNVKKTRRKRTIIIGIVSGVGGALILGCCIFLLYNRRKKQRQASLSNLLSRSTSSKISSKKDPELGDTNYHTHIFSYDELEEATDGFNVSRELGDGGFGTVYKGKLRDGRTVAVKRLYENNYRRVEQFMNEVEILSRLRHKNLVNLYGCTSRHSRELLLVYEYIPNGTLADHLHGQLASNAALPWPVRMSIAIETADALSYLHAVEPQIIHRDVKTNNILLDSSFHVKVADFGLSRLFPLDATHVSTAPQGTPGYVDPEYHQCYQLTDKSDVYSFGVVLVELISSKPAVDINRHRHEINLASMAITKIQNCQIDQLVDPELGYQSHPDIKGMINQVAELAFRCLQSDGEMRPCIKDVLEVLKGLEGGGYKAENETEVAEKETEVAEVQMKEEAHLLKNVLPFSPDSVTETWSSRSTTPNTST